MKKIVTLCLLSLLAVGTYGQNKKNTFDPSLLKTSADSMIYALGQDMMQGLRQHLIQSEVLQDTTSATFNAKANAQNINMFLKGLNESFSNTDSKKKAYNTGLGVGPLLVNSGKQFAEQMLQDSTFNKEVLIRSITAALSDQPSVIENPSMYLQQKAEEARRLEELKKAEEMKAQYQPRIDEEAKFLEENKTKDGMQTLPNGLQYKVIAEGTGLKPESTDRVTVHYEGRLLDGTVFDSSYKRGEPATFGVTQVIKGWTEVLQLMPAGSKWTVYIPYNLAYGERDTGAIPPFSTLSFDIELIEVVK